MATFAQLYQPMTGADEALHPLLKHLYDSLNAGSVDLLKVKQTIIEVLEFLSSPPGRSDENCRTVDFFLRADEAWDAERLPQEYVDVLARMSEALHDTVSAPEVARNFECAPEQLLERAKRL